MSIITLQLWEDPGQQLLSWLVELVCPLSCLTASSSVCLCFSLCVCLNDLFVDCLDASAFGSAFISLQDGTLALESAHTRPSHSLRNSSMVVLKTVPISCLSG